MSNPNPHSRQINQIASLLNSMGMEHDDIGEVVELITDILEGNNYDEDCSDDDISEEEYIEDPPSPPPQQKPKIKVMTPNVPRPQTAPATPILTPLAIKKPTSGTTSTQSKPSSSVITSIKGTSTSSTAKVMDCIPVGGGVQTLVNRFVDFCKSKGVDPETARKFIASKLSKRTKVVDAHLYVEGSVTQSDIIGCLKEMKK